jgi:hypothetical protein
MYDANYQHFNRACYTAKTFNKLVQLLLLDAFKQSIPQLTTKTYLVLYSAEERRDEIAGTMAESNEKYAIHHRSASNP